MSMFITCMGECLIDFLPLPEREGGAITDFRMHAGGSIFNVAVGVARLEGATAFASKLADDYFGRYLRAHLEAEKIDTRFLTLAQQGRSTLAFVAIEEGKFTYSFYGEGTADELLTFDEIPDDLFAQTSVLHFGSISLLRGTTPEAVLKTVKRLKGKALLSFDPNIRPNMIYDEQRYRALLRKSIALTDIVKVSDADLAWMMEGKPVEQVLHELLAQGPALVIITRGAQGAIAARTGGPMVQMPNFAVDVVDTVGAGDSFCAGILTQLAERGMTSRAALEGITEEALGQILRFATGVSALNCTRAGADPPRRAEIEHFLKGTSSSQEIEQVSRKFRNVL